MTTTEDTVQISDLITFNEEDKNIVKNDYAANLVRRARAGYVDTPTVSGMSFRFTCVYDKYVAAGRSYCRPIGILHSYTTKGAKPTRVRFVFATYGDYYSKSGSTYKFLQQDYTYSIEDIRTNPQSNTVYGKTREMSTTRCIRPYSHAVSGTAFGYWITANGKTSYFENGFVF